MQILLKISLKKVLEEAGRLSLYHAETRGGSAEEFHTLAVNEADGPLLATLLGLAWSGLLERLRGALVSHGRTPQYGSVELDVAPGREGAAALAERLEACATLFMVSVVDYEWLRLRGVETDTDITDTASAVMERMERLGAALSAAAGSGRGIASRRGFPPF